MEATIGLQEIIERSRSRFGEVYSRPPRWIVAAPGRVNLIGEHIDYNDGYVLPLAIDRYVVIAADRAADPAAITLHSANMDETATLPGVDAEPGRHQGWSAYPAGVLALSAQAGFAIPPFDAVIESTVTLGSGLSSSAALEVATATLVEAITGRTFEPVQKALLCQRAEHVYAGVPCGIMDQFSSVFGQADHVMLLDCQSRAIEQVPFDASDVAVLIANTNVKHELADGEYGARRKQCEQAARKLGIGSWRDLSREELDGKRGVLDEVEYRRASHVVSEIARTVDASHAIRAKNWSAMGRLMYESHRSLRDDYEVSCDELDIMVEAARGIGESGGVYGSRMTGGGFGGCTVSLVRAERAEEIMTALAKEYEVRTRIAPLLFTTRPSRGAHIVQK